GLQTADRRRARLRAAVEHRGGAPVRGLQPALRARLDPGHEQPAVRRVDIRVRLGAADRGPPRSAHAPRPHPRDERRELSPQSQSKAARQTRDPDQRQLTSRRTSTRRDPHASAEWYGLAPPRRYAINPAFTIARQLRLAPCVSTSPTGRKACCMKCWWLPSMPPT